MTEKEQLIEFIRTATEAQLLEFASLIRKDTKSTPLSIKLADIIEDRIDADSIKLN